MRIVKCENGLFKVILKGISEPFYVPSQDLALEIAWKLGSDKNE